jgi:hypothetical protein
MFTIFMSRAGLWLLVGLCLLSQTATSLSPRQRLAPPPGLPCDRNHLTSYAGEVKAYSRKPQQIFLRVRTDEATTEQFRLRVRKNEPPLSLFLLNGAAIKPEELAAIEKKLAQKAAVRVIVWACRNSAHRIIDWRVTPD